MVDIIPSAEELESTHQILKTLPENVSLFKCPTCRYIFDIYQPYKGLDPSILVILSDRKDIYCPRCKTGNAELMCKVDAYSIYLKLKGFSCRKGEMINGTDICPVCKTSMCPECGNHNVVALSRVTGYVQDVGGWNMAKKQELLDRKRYIIGETRKKIEIIQ